MSKNIMNLCVEQFGSVAASYRQIPTWLALIVLIAPIVACTDRIEKRYADRAEASERGLIAPGDQYDRILPPSARDITLVFDTDTGSSWLDFALDPADHAKSQVTCRERGATDIPFPRWKPNWWPPISVAEGATKRFAYLSCSQGEFMVVDRDNDRAYFWYSPQ
jgi:hypothetical protein